MYILTLSEITLETGDATVLVNLKINESSWMGESYSSTVILWGIKYLPEHCLKGTCIDWLSTYWGLKSLSLGCEDPSVCM